MIRENVVDDWRCNHGIIVQYRLSNKKCLCLPSYYDHTLISIRTCFNNYWNRYTY